MSKGFDKLIKDGLEWENKSKYQRFIENIKESAKERINQSYKNSMRRINTKTANAYEAARIRNKNQLRKKKTIGKIRTKLKQRTLGKPTNLQQKPFKF